MSIRNVILRQYQSKVNIATSMRKYAVFPPEGWICTVRKALSMSAAQLARRLGQTRANVSKTEKAEEEGRVTLKNMQKLAEAMNCHFVYAIVPEVSVEEVIRTRVIKKAKNLVQASSKQMALEDQMLSSKEINSEIERVTQEWLKNLPKNLWDDDI